MHTHAPTGTGGATTQRQKNKTKRTLSMAINSGGKTEAYKGPFDIC